ncbi:carboxylesterase family protein [Fodinicola feengrottensis]|uniref:carboxylesterase family protein n=1 Tax=Fodinicola feengrottensis TaxID=435914 RepID=UPI0013D7E0EF|nr:carboxylesterase family protein [Fodinicola feengrottensis]
MDRLVRIDRGTVRGDEVDGVVAFKSIPYAAAPVGAGRFALPQPPTWSGEWDARQSGPTAPQASGRLPGLNLTSLLDVGWVAGPDYLSASVWTPGGGGLPVLVFVHGGAFVGGSGTASGYGGTAFARDGVVLVSINYRLGVPGFAAIPGAPNNRGLYDQR